MQIDYEYDKSNPSSIEAYAKKLIGKTFADVIADKIGEDETIIQAYSNEKRKGGLGNLLEEVYFGYKANSNQSADFEEAGVELKATPYEKTKKGELRAGERLVLTMISYDNPVQVDFYKSHAWEKMKQILLIYYWRNKSLNNNMLYPIDYVKLFTPPETDLEIIKRDYAKIIGKIEAGRAHEISEGDTMYLGACTKGSTAEKSTVPQYYGDKIPARKRAFCFKNSYMTYVLNEYIAKQSDKLESIVKDTTIIQNIGFEDYCIHKFDNYIGKTDKEICSLIEHEYQPDNKAFWYTIVLRLLGIKSNHAAEFKKANVKVKSLKVMKNGKLKEQSPLPTIRFKELIGQRWEESEINEYFQTTKFFFLVWRESDLGFILEKACFWHMPQDVLENNVKDEWEKIVSVIRDGVKLQKTMNSNGIIIRNNIPGIKETKVIHMRPHTSKSAYKLNDGTIIGDYEKDGDELPTGEYMTRQSFWINKDFLQEQLKI